MLSKEQDEWELVAHHVDRLTMIQSILWSFKTSKIKYLQRKAIRVIFPRFEMYVQELVGK